MHEQALVGNSMKIAYKEHMEGGNQAMRWNGHGHGPHEHGWVHIKGDPIKEAPIQIIAREDTWGATSKCMGKLSSKNSRLWAPKN